MQIEIFGTNTEALSPTALDLPAGTERHIIADGVRGTEQTIALMQKMVNSYKRNDDIRALCGRVIANCKPKDYFDYCKKCYEWVRDNIKYAYDPHLVEYIESPKRLLKNKIGDCDSMDMLLASMFEQLGFACQFVTIMADASRPGEFTHVYTRVNVPKVGWVVADPIMNEKWFGWEPPYPQGKRYWHSSADELNTPLDTSDSIPIESNQSGPDQTGSGMSGLVGLSDIGRGGRHGGHDWGGRSGTWGWSGGDEVYVLPVTVPVVGQVFTPDQFSIVSDNVPQQFENPMDDQSVGISGLGWDWKDLGLDKVGDFASGFASVFYSPKTTTSKPGNINQIFQDAFSSGNSKTQTLDQARQSFIDAATTPEGIDKNATDFDSWSASQKAAGLTYNPTGSTFGPRASKQADSRNSLEVALDYYFPSLTKRDWFSGQPLKDSDPKTKDFISKYGPAIALGLGALLVVKILK